MPATQSEIARHLNLSKATVAKVLGNAKNTWISAETRERVLTAAREMGYVPSQSALSLRTGKTGAVALLVVMPEDAGPLPSVAIGSLAQTLGAARHNLVLRVVRGVAECLEVAKGLTDARSCDGLILWPDEAGALDVIEGLSALTLPIVIKGRFEALPESWIQVDFDHEGVMETAVAELWRRGHRRLCYFGHDNDFAFSRHLRRGFLDAVTRRVPMGTPAARIARVDNFWNRSRATMEGWLAEPDPPTAVVIGSGIFSWKGVEVAAARQGRRIGFGPGELAVVGIAASSRVLMVGEGLAFTTEGITELGTALGEALLGALTGAEISSREVRITPGFRPAEPLDYFDYGLEIARGLRLTGRN